MVESREAKRLLASSSLADESIESVVEETLDVGMATSSEPAKVWLWSVSPFCRTTSAHAWKHPATIIYFYSQPLLQVLRSAIDTFFLHLYVALRCI